MPSGVTAQGGTGLSDLMALLASSEATTGERSIDSIMGGTPERHPVSYGLAIGRVQRVVFETQAGIQIPAVVLRPRPEGRDFEAGVLVAVSDQGKGHLLSDPLIKEALRRSWMVWAIDPRGIGELAVTRQGWVSAVSLLLGEDFTSRQGWISIVPIVFRNGHLLSRLF